MPTVQMGMSTFCPWTRTDSCVCVWVYGCTCACVANDDDVLNEHEYFLSMDDD